MFSKNVFFVCYFWAYLLRDKKSKIYLKEYIFLWYRFFLNELSMILADYLPDPFLES